MALMSIFNFKSHVSKSHVNDTHRSLTERYFLLALNLILHNLNLQANHSNSTSTFSLNIDDKKVYHILHTYMRFFFFFFITEGTDFFYSLQVVKSSLPSPIGYLLSTLVSSLINNAAVKSWNEEVSSSLLHFQFMSNNL